MGDQTALPVPGGRVGIGVPTRQPPTSSLGGMSGPAPARVEGLGAELGPAVTSESCVVSRTTATTVAGCQTSGGGGQAGVVLVHGSQPAPDPDTRPDDAEPGAVPAAASLGVWALGSR